MKERKTLAKPLISPHIYRINAKWRERRTPHLLEFWQKGLPLQIAAHFTAMVIDAFCICGLKLDLILCSPSHRGLHSKEEKHMNRL